MFSFTPRTKIKSSEVNQNFTDLASGAGDLDANRLQLFRGEACFDFTQSGLMWTQVTGLNGTMTLGVAYIADTNVYMNRLALNSISSRAFTASKDTYVDVTSAGAVAYTEVANGATAPTLATYSMRIALVITGASAITAVFQTDQRQANSTPTDLGWSGLDSAGYPVRNTNPTQMEFRVTRHNGTVTRSSIGAGAAATLPNMSFNYRSGRIREKVIYELGAMRTLATTAGTVQIFVYQDGAQVFPQIYQDQVAGQWYTSQIATLPNYLSANTAFAITFRAAHTQTVNYVNNYVGL